DLAGQLHEQYRQAAWRRAERRARQTDAERAEHESIDPQPARSDRHEPAPDRDRDGDDEVYGGESDED
ncbi:MAG TPA: hypothetical protein VGF32_19990, partial [Streptosporangiaceae bacterium]